MPAADSWRDGDSGKKVKRGSKTKGGVTLQGIGPFYGLSFAFRGQGGAIISVVPSTATARVSGILGGARGIGMARGKDTNVFLACRIRGDFGQAVNYKGHDKKVMRAADGIHSTFLASTGQDIIVYRGRRWTAKF